MVTKKAEAPQLPVFALVVDLIVRHRALNPAL